MQAAEARIETERPSRYLVQLCKHAAAMGAGGGGHPPRLHARPDVRVSAEWSESRGTITFDPWGRCTAEANLNVLTLRVEAADDENVRRIQDILTRDLDRFGRRDNLTVRWRPAS